jgi:outer membrane protein assembly factor BamE (lipoprotein component of BamABCDE complex)
VEENANGFVVGRTTMDEVLEKCGTPSLHKDNYTWIYIGQKVEENNFKDIKQIYRFVVRMTFDEAKVLKSIEKIDPSKNDDLAMNEEYVNLIPDHQAAQRIKKVLSENNS